MSVDKSRLTDEQREVLKAHIVEYGEQGGQRSRQLERILCLVDKMLSSAAPAPTIPADCDVRKIPLRVVPGAGEGLEVYAKNVSEVESLLCEMGECLEDFDARATVPTMSEGRK